MNNVKPRDRQQRNTFSDKDIIEKTYINNRGGFESRNQDAKQLIYNASLQSSLQCPENERFDKDYAVHDKSVREAYSNRVQNFRESNRYNCYQRDTDKWNNYQSLDQKAELYLSNKSNAIFNGKRNVNYHGFNPINNRYESNPLGNSL